jgi:hypothetical protein
MITAARSSGSGHPRIKGNCCKLRLSIVVLAEPGSSLMNPSARTGNLLVVSAPEQALIIIDHCAVEGVSSPGALYAFTMWNMTSAARSSWKHSARLAQSARRLVPSVVSTSVWTKARTPKPNQSVLAMPLWYRSAVTASRTFSQPQCAWEALGHNLADDNAVRVDTGICAAVEDADRECEGAMDNVVPVDGALLCQAFMGNKGKLG